MLKVGYRFIVPQPEPFINVAAAICGRSDPCVCVIAKLEACITLCVNPLHVTLICKMELKSVKVPYAS